MGLTSIPSGLFQIKLSAGLFLNSFDANFDHSEGRVDAVEKCFTILDCDLRIEDAIDHITIKLLSGLDKERDTSNLKQEWIFEHTHFHTRVLEYFRY